MIYCFSIINLLITLIVLPLIIAINFDLNNYHDYTDFERFLFDAESEYPSIAQLRVIGKSREGRKLLGLKIGSSINNNEKPAIWIDGGNHAREWPAFHLAANFIEKLLTNYGNNEIITEYVNRLNFYIFPVLNPDGFIYSRSSRRDTIRQWRKNRASIDCTGFLPWQLTSMCCEGVDLNRNWDIGFSKRNYPFNNSCSDEFQGPFPFSEPETRAVRDFILSKELNGKVHAYLSMHTHGQLFILPYNYRRKTYPKDYEDLKSLAQRSAAAIQSIFDTVYRVGTAADMLGPATGGATDWIKKNTNIKYVYVIELPPDIKTSFAFQMRPYWLKPTAKETWEGVRVIIEQVIREFTQ